MTKRLIIKSKAAGEVSAELREELNPKTCKAIFDNLPLAGRANRWGDEIYFAIPLSIDEENSVQDVEIGDVAYWPPGRAICVFFGKTPVSRSEKPRAYSPVNVFARITENAMVLSKVADGDKIEVKRG